MKKKLELAKDLLTRNNILLGYELEDGELEGNNKQMLVRSISGSNFNEIWNHGKKHCSKMTIYLISNDLFIERRPDMLNYEIDKDDLMHSDQIMKGALNINEEYGQEYDRALSSYRLRLKGRVKWILENLIDVVEIGEDSWNIIFKE